MRYKPAGYPDSTLSFENVTAFQHTVVLEIRDLIVFQEYQISVAAYNSRGIGVYSSWIIVRTHEGRPLAAPHNVTVTVLSSTSLSVSWFPPNPQHINGIIQGYHIDAVAHFDVAKEQASFSRYTVSSNISNMFGKQNLLLQNLYKYVEYEITISCFTSAGEGPTSAPVNTRTLEDGN